MSGVTCVVPNEGETCVSRHSAVLQQDRPLTNDPAMTRPPHSSKCCFHKRLSRARRLSFRTEGIPSQRYIQHFPPHAILSKTTRPPKHCTDIMARHNTNDYGTSAGTSNKLHRPIILANHVLHWISALIVMSIAAYFISAFPHNTHLRYWVSIVSAECPFFSISPSIDIPRLPSM